MDDQEFQIYCPRLRRHIYFNYYDLLHVDPTASLDEIKRSYRDLARQFHPDKCDPSKKEMSKEKFKIIYGAYQTLIDPAKRYQYNEFLAKKGLKLQLRKWAAAAAASASATTSSNEDFLNFQFKSRMFDFNFQNKSRFPSSNPPDHHLSAFFLNPNLIFQQSSQQQQQHQTQYDSFGHQQKHEYMLGTSPNTLNSSKPSIDPNSYNCNSHSKSAKAPILLEEIYATTPISEYQSTEAGEDRYNHFDVSFEDYNTTPVSISSSAAFNTQGTTAGQSSSSSSSSSSASSNQQSKYRTQNSSIDNIYSRFSFLNKQHENTTPCFKNFSFLKDIFDDEQPTLNHNPDQTNQEVKPSSTPANSSLYNKATTTATTTTSTTIPVSSSHNSINDPNEDINNEESEEEYEESRIEIELSDNDGDQSCAEIEYEEFQQQLASAAPSNQGASTTTKIIVQSDVDFCAAIDNSLTKQNIDIPTGQIPDQQKQSIKIKQIEDLDDDDAIARKIVKRIKSKQSIFKFTRKTRN